MDISLNVRFGIDVLKESPGKREIRTGSEAYRRN